MALVNNSSSSEINLVLQGIIDHRMHTTDFPEAVLSSRGKDEVTCLEEKHLEELREFTLFESFYYWDRDYQIEPVVDLLSELFPQGKGLTDEMFSRFVVLDDLCFSITTYKHFIAAGTSNGRGNLTNDDDKNGWLLLHKVASGLAPVELLEVVLDLYPEAAWHQDHRHRLPLHVMVENVRQFRSIDVMERFQVILKANPDAAKVKDKNGLMPLHRLCLSWDFYLVEEMPNTCLDLLQMIYDANPLALQRRIVGSRMVNSEIKSHFLLHLIAEEVHPWSPRMMFFFLKKYPHGAFLKNEPFGMTVFQTIALYQEEIAWEIIQQVNKSDNLKQLFFNLRDEQNGNNLLHIFSTKSLRPKGARYHASSQTQQIIFEWLLKTFPQLAKEKNKYGELPVHVGLCQTMIHKEDVANISFDQYHDDIVALVTTYDAVCRDKKEVNELHFGSKSQHPIFLAASQKEPCISTVFFFAKRFVEVHGKFRFD